MNYLTIRNPKTQKGEAAGWITFIMHFAPASESGYNVCGHSTTECRHLCLNWAGRGKFDRTQNARKRKTREFFEHRKQFMANLVKDVSRAVNYASRRSKKLAVRLNGTSDIPWESIRCGSFKNIMERFPFVQFYDYTKIPGRTKLPLNYHLTFSRSELNDKRSLKELAAGNNVAMVFDKVPARFNDYPVIDGDANDLRFLDPPGHIIGLKNKGRAVNSQSMFILRNSNDGSHHALAA